MTEEECRTAARLARKRTRSERKRGHGRDVVHSVSNNNADGKPCKKNAPSTPHGGFPARTPKKTPPKTLKFPKKSLLLQRR